MRFHTLLVATLALTAPLTSIPTIEAFTVGTLLPSYLCGPAKANADGTIVGTDAAAMPKALGGVLNQFQEYIPGGEHYVTKPAELVAKVGAGGDSQALVAAFHNANAATQNIIFTGTNVIQRATSVLDPNILNGAIPIAPQVNVLDVGRIQALPPPAAAVLNAAGDEVVAALDANMAIPSPAGVTHTMTTNEVVTLTLQSKNNVPAQLSGTVLTAAQFAASGTQPVLDGAILYVQDANNNRVGKFTTGGPNMDIWAGCGADAQGLVHNALLSESNSYNGPQFFLPWSFFAPIQSKAPAPKTVTFMGAAVTDNGFGFHQTQWTVTPQTVALDVFALNLGDAVKCATATLPCFAACAQCAQKGGSTTKTKAKGVSFQCTPNIQLGNPMQNQMTIWTPTCKINNAVTAVAAAGTVVIPPLKPAGADQTPTADALALQDQLTQLILTTNNGTTMDMEAMDAMAQQPPQCRSNVNHATSSSPVSLFTTVVVSVVALFAGSQ